MEVRQFPSDHGALAFGEMPAREVAGDDEAERIGISNKRTPMISSEKLLGSNGEDICSCDYAQARCRDRRMSALPLRISETRNAAGQIIRRQ